mmetsp:Transcript_52391/g.67188  ORF Transcript_52391/g.67188 Transcript_52391/m.67188 type:complete len:315 (-) Transcript_52391:235-1179(-)
MGTTTSTSNTGSSVIYLSRGTKAQAFLSHPPNLPCSTGLVILCDPATNFFDSPDIRHIAEYFSQIGGLLTISLELVSDDTNIERIGDAAFELKSRGAAVISVCGFGEGAIWALKSTQTTESQFGAIALISPPFSQALYYAKNVKVPSLLILGGIDEDTSFEQGNEIVNCISSKSISSQLRWYRDQKKGFVEHEGGLAAITAMKHILKWLRKYNSDPSLTEKWRVDDMLEHAPKEEEWWSSRGFQNVGESNWHQTRKEWRNYKDKTRPKAPKLVPYEVVVEGFVEPLRTFELPGRMSLPNMVSVLTDIWEIEGVS